MKRPWRPSMSMQGALGVLGTVGFLALWQAANAWKLVDPVLLPAPEVVFSALRGGRRLGGSRGAEVAGLVLDARVADR